MLARVSNHIRFSTTDLGGGGVIGALPSEFKSRTRSVSARPLSLRCTMRQNKESDSPTPPPTPDTPSASTPPTAPSSLVGSDFFNFFFLKYKYHVGWLKTNGIE